jgi:hypothetical protein
MPNDEFVLRPRANAVLLLIGRFPDLRRQLNEDLSQDEPYYAYGVFSQQIRQRQEDSEFFSAACRFLTELADRRESHIEDILLAAVFEEIAEDRRLSDRMRSCLGPAAKALLEKVLNG